MLQLLRKVAAQPTGLSQDFFPCGFVKRQYQFLMFERTQVGNIVSVIDDDDSGGRP